MRKIFKFFKRLIFAIIALSLLSLAAWAYLTSNYAKPHIAYVVSENLKNIIDSDVSIGNVSFSFPGTFTLSDVVLSDADAPWLTLKTLNVSVVPAEILKGKIIIRSLEFDTAELLTLPEHLYSTPKALSPSDSSPNITIESITLHQIAITPAFISRFNRFPEHFSEEIMLNAGISSSSGIWKGNVTLETRLESAPLTVSSGFTWDPDKYLALNELSLSGYGSMAEGSLLYEHATGWLEANIKGTSSDISFLNPWLPEAVGGKADFTAQWTGTEDASVQLEVKSPLARYQDLSFKDVVLIASLSDIFKDFQANIHASMGQIIDRETIFNDLTLATTVDSRRENWPVILSMGNSEDILSLNTEGFWFFTHKKLQLSLHHLQGKIFDIPVNLQDHLLLQITPANVELSPFAFHLGEGSLKASLKYEVPTLSSSLQFENIPLKLLPSQITGASLQGSISGQALVNGTLQAPHVDSQFQFKEIKIDQKDFNTLPPISGQLQIGLNENGFNGNGLVVPFDHSPLHFEIQLPVTAALDPPALTINKTAPIVGNIKASGEIQKILQLFFKDPISLSGEIDAAVSLGGTLGSPLFNGTATVSKGSFEILETGTVLHNVSGDFESSGKEVYLRNLSATDKYGQPLSGTGRATLEAADRFPFQLDLKMNQLAVIDQDMITGAFSGDLTLKGNGEGASLTGSATANSLVITIPDQAAAVVNALDVTYINEPQNEKKTLVDDDPTWPLILEINVAAPENITVSSKDLSSEWKGNLAVKGSAQNPSLVGNFKITSGQYFFNGKNFDINQGSISLNGPLDNKSSTTLYVIASKDLGKVKVEVIAKGAVSNPEISFRSNPPMPQREILSWILFNRGTSEISPFQGSQLTESITNLKSSGSKGPDVLTKIRNSLGIDRLEISRDENSGNASIQVGKYISDNIFISVNKSDVNRIAVEAALLPNIKLQAQVGDDSEGQLLLKWKHDY